MINFSTYPHIKDLVVYYAQVLNKAKTLELITNSLSKESDAQLLSEKLNQKLNDSHHIVR